MMKISRTARFVGFDFRRDNKAVAAVEFAVILPVMLLMFFGTVELSSAVSASRKVTQMASTLADLTSQSTTVAIGDLNNFFGAAGAIMTPYLTPPTQARISQLYIDPTTHQAIVKWSKVSSVTTTLTPRALNSIVTIPATLAIDGTYLIFSEVSYKYMPAAGYVIPGGVTLSDVGYARPRYSDSVACSTC